MAEYEVLAVRYGVRDTTRHDSFYRYAIYGDPDGPIQLDYFFWVMRDGTDVVLLDSGFNSAAALRRGRVPLVEPVDALARLGIAPASVTRIIVSHCHWDHIGNLTSFPDAELVVQRRELEFWTSAVARRPQFAASSETAEIEYIVAAGREGRVRVLEGDAAIAPGVRARLCGGHCPGQQLITVDTGARPVVLASDALHFYEEMERDRPFAVFHDLEATYKTFDLLDADERHGAVVVAGHDPRVMEQFAPFSSATADLAVRLG